MILEDLFGIIVFALYLVFALSGSKKKKERKRKADTRPAQFERVFETAASGQGDRFERSAPARPTATFSSREEKGTAHAEGDDPCHEDMLGAQRPAMRLRSVSQVQLAEAAEGEDPCHTGGAESSFDRAETSPIMHSPIFDAEDKEAFARDVLRGVIMSEVLARPSDRRRAGMKRGA